MSANLPIPTLIPIGIPKIKKITHKTIKEMQIYFNNKYLFNINLILSNKSNHTKGKKRYPLNY